VQSACFAVPTQRNIRIAMHFRTKYTPLSCCWIALLMLSAFGQAAAAQQPAPAPARVVGTVQSISGRSLTVISDSGAPSSVLVEEATKLLQIEPGKTNLSEATPFSFTDLQPGDRVLVRGILADDGKTIRAATLIAVKKAALAEKQSKERAEWQRGVGGLVKSVDTSASTISISTNALAAKKEVVVHFTSGTVFRRYASDSTRFDAARIAAVTEIQPGDQLRAKGTRSEGGADLNATEIVSGTFRNIAGTVTASDSATNTLVVQDLATKTPVTLKISSESQMRKLPPQFAESLAARLKNQSAGAGQSQPNSQSAAPQQPAQPPQEGAAPGAPGQRGAGGDFQQVIARMPAATLSDLQKGEAVMVVTTQGNGKDPLTVVTLLGGVEPILRSSTKGAQDMILSPWSLGGGEPSGN
jgi:Domain of unknown function (DUF5666)